MQQLNAGSSRNKGFLRVMLQRISETHLTPLVEGHLKFAPKDRQKKRH
jgi:hypothetical protein